MTWTHQKWALSLLLQSLALISTITVYCIWDVSPGGSNVKESAFNAGDLGSISGSGRSPGEGNGYPVQYSCLENPMDRGAWQVTKSQTQLSDEHFSSKISKAVWSLLSHLLQFSAKIPSSVPLPSNATVASCLRLSSTQYNGQLYFLQTPLENRLAGNSWISALIHLLDYTLLTPTGTWLTLVRISGTIHWAEILNLFHRLLMAVLILANTESAPCPPFHLPTKSDWDLVNIHFLEDALSVSPDLEVSAMLSPFSRQGL